MKNKITKAIKIAKEYFNYAKQKRYDTLAGTMSFFFLLSFIPLLYLCLSLYINMGTWFGLETPIPEELKKYISFDLNAGASIFFILTTIYSASKFFLQLRKTGEIVYEIKKPRVNTTSTVISCLLVIVAMLVVSIGLLSIALAKKYLSDFIWAQVLIQLVTYLLIGGIFFALVTVVNYFACQIDKIKIKQLMPGIITSFIMVVLVSSLFGVYLGFTSYDALYGFFATVIVAAIYVNFMMQALIIGIIINEKRLRPLLKNNVEHEDPAKKLVGGIVDKIKHKK